VRRLWLFLAAALLCASYAAAEQLAAGKLLVATPKSQDPDLSRSVILLIHCDRDGAIGLMLNRPSKVPLRDVMPELKNAKAPVFAGGPVTIGVRALLKSSSKPDQAPHLFADVSVISTKSTLEKLIAAHTPPNVFRVYAGYTGWTLGQLQDEVNRGLWQVLPGDAGVIFDPAPEKLWDRLTAAAKNSRQ